MKFESQFAETSLGPGAHEHAVVLAPVKERPGNLAASRTACVSAVLTADRHDSLGYMQAGTKRCSQPNQKRRIECSRIKYPETSPFHEIGQVHGAALRDPCGKPRFLSQTLSLLQLPLA
jgi:hypothetical protein